MTSQGRKQRRHRFNFPQSGEVSINLPIRTGGGAAGCVDPVFHGYIFELARGNGGWQYSTPVYWDNTEFDAGGALALDAQGNLYGTTSDCGEYNKGTVWELTATQ